MYYNKFIIYKCYDDEFWEYFVEDMLCLVFKWRTKIDKKVYTNKINIDLGWHPEMNINGEFALYVVKDDNWNCPLAEFRTRSQSQVVSIIETYLTEYSKPCYRKRT